ncbi:MAG TPA: hypothetical protein V6C84_07485 [Coleofasciculaceae cyanobacterium]|jgi:hypothetical protein
MLLVSLPSINLEFLKAVKGMVSIIRDPSQTESVFDIVLVSLFFRHWQEKTQQARQ